MAEESDVIALLDAAVSTMGGQNRPGQHEMTRQVVRAMETGEHLLVQAGTGTGKSMAYLVPALAHALDSEKPVVISTATLALQAQIVGRDVPRLLSSLKDKLPREMDVALVKGRSNYVCQYKLGGGYPDDDEGALFSMDSGTPALGGSADGPGSVLGKEVVRLRQWAEQTDTGDRDDLAPGVSDKAWRQVSVSAMDCLGSQKCPMASECFSELARARAATADVVITNHAMLAVSAFEGLAVLPDFDTVIIDEAHELQDRVTSSVTRPLSVAMVQAAASAARKHCSVSVDSLNQGAKALQRALEGVPTGLMARGLNEDQQAAINQIAEAARVVLSDSKPEANAPADGGRQMARSQVMYLVEQCSKMLEMTEEREVIWASRPGHFSPGEGYVQPDESSQPTLNVAPLSVAGKLREGLFDGRTVILTSATLAIGAAFEPVAGTLGLVGEGAPTWNGVDVGSPFDYPRQGILYVAKHLPKPGRQMSQETLSEIEDLIKASGGGALALFTSRRAAEEAAEILRARLDIPILCQGESSMKALVDQFSAEPDTCLFGTMTLWQGVDVPGNACRLVIIDKIPFPRPDDPLSSARSRDVAKHGGNGFMAVAASHAAVRLAQGAGRLIRSVNDKGVVAVLDSRLATERYGTFLRASLPPLWATPDKATVISALERLSEG
ncbi:ATP-dependent DNA helicase [Paeniglutamicibacter psychrophenolicus]|uniref:ATP-dependent DNA helicase n=1 Tax=Paeniglutamicibacter psychrophenolicus TaxID=257454 RepID=UPI0027835E0E|nr:ATP-dependent DNA helicase [Paeniglutamicibacter psychrophenolicus]MDQ0094943.1 ATP-dependent DNA helicase DinG [Paeniglutamicibacter psychrophenolicus]